MKFFDRFFPPVSDSPSVDSSEHLVHLATATLLVEMVRADFNTSQSEVAKVHSLLERHFQLNAQELNELMDLAASEADQMVSIQHLTRILIDRTDHDMRVRIVEMLWQVVYADGVKDHHEEHFVRQVAELLYVSHAEFIQARHKAEPDGER